MKNLDLSKEIQSIKNKISQIGGYHIVKENQKELYIVQCYYKNFDRYVKHNNITTEPITIFKDLKISQSFRVGNILYCRDE